MIPIFILTLLLCAAELIHMLIAWINNAPEGYEDEDGFHYGANPAVVMLDYCGSEQ